MLEVVLGDDEVLMVLQGIQQVQERVGPCQPLLEILRPVRIVQDLASDHHQRVEVGVTLDIVERSETSMDVKPKQFSRSELRTHEPLQFTVRPEELGSSPGRIYLARLGGSRLFRSH